MKTLKEIQSETEKEFDRKFIDMSYIDNEIWFANIFMPDGELKKTISEKDKIGLPMVYIESVKYFISSAIKKAFSLGRDFEKQSRDITPTTNKPVHKGTDEVINLLNKK